MRQRFTGIDFLRHICAQNSDDVDDFTVHEIMETLKDAIRVVTGDDWPIPPADPLPVTTQDEMALRLEQSEAELTQPRAERQTLIDEIKELREWKHDEQLHLARMAVTLLDAGYKGDGVVDGLDWLQAERDLLRARVRASEWQPIETAPKDRRWVLVWNEDDEYSVYRFGPGLMSEPDDPQWTHWKAIDSPRPAPPTGTP